MTNQCPSCTHSAEYETEPMLLRLHCLHPVNTVHGVLPIYTMPTDCKHYEYEAGTDADQQGGGEPKPTT